MRPNKNFKNKHMKINNIYSFLIGISVIIIVSSCAKEWEHDYPKLKSISVEEYNDTSLIFTGEVECLGDDEVNEYGCCVVYGVQNFYPYSKNGIKEGKFKLIFSPPLRKDVNFISKTYAKIGNKVVFGDDIKFKCELEIYPEIISVTPISGTADTKRTVIVKNFINMGYYYIKLDQIPLYNLTVIDNNKIEFTPTNISPGSYSVSISNIGIDTYDQQLIITE